MDLFGPKIEWSEPWSWGKVKRAAEEIRNAYPPLWRLSLYCAVFPLGVLLLAILYIRHIAPDDPFLERASHLWFILPLGCVAMFMILPYLHALFPLGIIMRRKTIAFVRGNSTSFIKVERVAYLCFRTIEGRRHFVVAATTSKGKSFEQTIEMSTKKVTESDVVRFLHDMGLSHLYRSGDGI